MNADKNALTIVLAAVLCSFLPLSVPVARAGLKVMPLGKLNTKLGPRDEQGGTERKWRRVRKDLGIDPARVAVRQCAANMGGNTSVRNESPLCWKAKGYFRRCRDLGQVFTAEDDFTLDAVVLRTGNGRLAFLEGAAGAPVFVQLFAVAGEPRIDDNGTPPGTAAKHGFSKNHRCDDFVTGVTYRSLRVAGGGVMPDLAGDGDGRLVYFRLDLTGDDELKLDAGRRYAFMVGIEKPGPNRNFTLANDNKASLSAPPRMKDPGTYPGGWGLRREGSGERPLKIPGPNPPADESLRENLRRQSRFPGGEQRFALAPTCEGFPDVDTYRDLEFYIIRRPAGGDAAAYGAETGWVPLFDGHALDGWRAPDGNDNWRVAEGSLIGRGSGYLYYDGPAEGGDFLNFELTAAARTTPGAVSGIWFHTRPRPGTPAGGYEVRINNGTGQRSKPGGWLRTGSLAGVRNICTSCAADGTWFELRVSVIGKRIRVWVDGMPTVDYVEPADPPRGPGRSRRLSRGTVALRGPGPRGTVTFRSVRIRPLPAGADPFAAPRAPDSGYGLTAEAMDRLAGKYIPFVDCHVHLRGGMTVAKAMQRQAVTGINIGVLKNIGTGWPIETDDQLRAFLDEVRGKPLPAGLQVNDRDWMTKHSPQLLGRLDYVLGDTMIMPMPDDDGPPVKLWKTKEYIIDDPERWMVRYVRHTLRVLAEPVTVLANPTWLPGPVRDRYDDLWTKDRMRTVIRAAIKNGTALEINARSGYPRERFIRLARKMGATFTFGTNNFRADPIDMSRCLEAVRKYDLTAEQLYVPGLKRDRTGRNATDEDGGGKN